MIQARRIGYMVMVIILLFSSVLSVSAAAAEGVEPRLNNTNDVTANFVIIDANNAVISATFEGHRGITSNATIKIQLQRKVLFWWTDVDSASWTDSFNNYYGTASHSIRLSKTGEYRAVIDFTIYGSGGTPDTLSLTLYDEC